MNTAPVYDLMRAALRFTAPPDTIAGLALRFPGEAGAVLFCIARDDDAETAAATLKVNPDALEAIAGTLSERMAREYRAQTEDERGPQ